MPLFPRRKKPAPINLVEALADGSTAVGAWNRGWTVVFARRDPRDKGGIDTSELVHVAECDVVKKVLYLVPGSPPKHCIDGDVFDFNQKFSHPCPSAPECPPVEVLTFRGKLITEEYRELMHELSVLIWLRESDASKAALYRQMAKVAAEGVDLIYVTVGLFVNMGVRMMPFWRDVHRANMQKEANPDGGKPLKPEGWTPPQPYKLLQRQVKKAEAEVVDWSEPESP